MIKFIPTTSVLIDLPHFLHTYLVTCQLYTPVSMAQEPPAPEPGGLSLSLRCCCSAGPQPCFFPVVWIFCLSLGPVLMPCCRLMHSGVPMGPTAVPPTLLLWLSLLVTHCLSMSQSPSAPGSRTPGNSPVPAAPWHILIRWLTLSNLLFWSWYSFSFHS